MENNAIMNNKVIETTEEVIENTGMSKGIKIAAGVGLSVIVGFVVYKYVAKPVIANIKTQIELKRWLLRRRQSLLTKQTFLQKKTEI